MVKLHIIYWYALKTPSKHPFVSKLQIYTSKELCLQIALYAIESNACDEAIEFRSACYATGFSDCGYFGP